jgi:hypothetical protein
MEGRIELYCCEKLTIYFFVVSNIICKFAAENKTSSTTDVHLILNGFAP